MASKFKIGNDLATLDFWGGLYFSTVTMATLGYGDIVPLVDPWNCVFWAVILQIVFGLYYLSVFVATMVSWIRGIQRPPTLKELLEESDCLDKQDLATRQRTE